MVFARLAWPGYRVTLDGRSIPLRTVAKTFVAVDIPPGTHDATLTLTWRPPGWKIGIGSALAGSAGLGLLQWWYRRGSRPGSRAPEPLPRSTADPREPALV